MSTVILTIFAPPEIEERVSRCVRSIGREFAGDDLLVGIDGASLDLMKLIAINRFCTIELRGVPPRLGRFLEMASKICETEYLWTIEQDCEVAPGTKESIEGLMQQFPQVAGIDCMTTNLLGLNNYPNAKKPRKPLVESKGMLDYCRCHLSLNCVCWRAAVLKKIDWTKVMNFPACDQQISSLVRGLGQDWALCIAPEIKVVHHFLNARRFLPEEKRYCEMSWGTKYAKPRGQG